MAQRKLAIVSTHPIQYYAPLFRALTELGSLDLRVFYTWSQTADQQVFDPGFGGEVKWDIPLLSGYAHQFVENVAKHPGTHHFAGLKNPTLIREIEAWGAQAVLVYGWNYHSHLQTLRHFKGLIPVLFRGDSTLLDDRSWWRSTLRRGLLRWVYRHVDVAAAVGANNRDYFAWCGLPPECIDYAPHSVDTVRFAAQGTSHEARAGEWRRQLGIPPDAIVFLFAGKLQPKKDPLLLLEAFRPLDERGYLVFVGNGELEAEIKARASAQKCVRFLPFQNQTAMPAVYRLGDLFVLPSRGPGETWGLALNEAMASGRAVIASSKVGGARDLIQAERTGWSFESGDQAALNHILCKALELGQFRLRAMGLQAQRESDAWSTATSAGAIAASVLRARPRR